MTIKELETAIEVKLDERFELMESNLKEYIGGYFEHVKKTTDDIQRNQHQDRDILDKWKRDEFPELINAARRILAKFNITKDDLTKAVSEAAKTGVTNGASEAIKDGIENFIDKVEEIKPKKLSLTDMLLFRKINKNMDKPKKGSNFKLAKGAGLNESSEQPLVTYATPWLKDPITYILFIGFIVLTATNLSPLLDIWVKDPATLNNLKLSISIVTGYLGLLSAWLARVFRVDSPITFNP